MSGLAAEDIIDFSFKLKVGYYSSHAQLLYFLKIQLNIFFWSNGLYYFIELVILVSYHMYCWNVVFVQVSKRTRLASTPFISAAGREKYGFHKKSLCIAL